MYGVIYADEPIRDFLERYHLTIGELFALNPELRTQFTMQQVEQSTNAEKAYLKVKEK